VAVTSVVSRAVVPTVKSEAVPLAILMAPKQTLASVSKSGQAYLPSESGSTATAVTVPEAFTNR
jgi:hypothetical protein